MTAVSVTSVVGTTAHFSFFPQANQDVTGLGITVPDPLTGWVNTAFDTSWTGSGWDYDVDTQIVTWQLDSSFQYDLRIDFRNAPPIIAFGFTPAAGDLLEQLNAQGWESLA